MYLFVYNESVSLLTHLRKSLIHVIRERLDHFREGCSV
jgi:hypothetical protein